MVVTIVLCTSITTIHRQADLSNHPAISLTTTLAVLFIHSIMQLARFFIALAVLAFAMLATAENGPFHEQALAKRQSR